MSGQTGNNERPQEGNGYVYIIHAVGTNRIKIGFSTRPQERLATLQTGSPFKLQMIACVPGDRNDERRAHREFGQYRQLGEWFEIPPLRPPHVQGHTWRATANGWKLYTRQPAVSATGRRSSKHKYLAYYSQAAVDMCARRELV